MPNEASTVWPIPVLIQHTIKFKLMCCCCCLVCCMHRGMVDAAGKPVLEYPYADDGLRIWQSMEKYFDAYLAHYYGSDADGDAEVARDTELQDWWKDVTVSGAA